MRSLIIVLVIAFFISSCGWIGGPYPFAGVNIEYPNISDVRDIYCIQVDSKMDFKILDTVIITELNEYNNYSFSIDFDVYQEDFIVAVEETNYIDTITDIYYERSDRNNSIKDFEYKLNGEISSDQTIIITEED